MSEDIPIIKRTDSVGEKPTRRAHERFSSSIAEIIVAQQNWQHFVQLFVMGNTVIIGQILDISEGGLGLKVPYHFDIVDIIPVKVKLSVRRSDSSFFTYDLFEINASIIRSERLDDSFSIIGLMFAAEEGSEPYNKIKRLINQIRFT